MNMHPIIGWLVLAAVMAGLLLPNLSIALALIAAACALYILTSRERRYALLLAPIAIAGVLAPQFMLPLPETWPGLVRLAITLGGWLLVAVGLTAFILSALNNDTADLHDDLDEEE